MIQRKVSKAKYFFAFFFTLLVFLSGFLLGLVIEGKRIAYTSTIFQEHTVDLSSSQLQYTYLSSLKTNEACPVVYDALEKNLVTLDRTRAQLEKFAADSKISDDEFTVLKRQYALEQLRYWLLASSVKDLCKQQFVRILYFYSNDEQCPGCEEQEFILTYLKKKFGQNLLIFSVDEQLNEPMIQLLEKQYNITSFPGIVVEEKKVNAIPYASQEMMEKEICSSGEGMC